MVRDETLDNILSLLAAWKQKPYLMAENIIFIIVGDILQVVLHFSDPVGVRKMPATRKNVS